MRWVRDPTGRFPQRPHYDLPEFDDECEALVNDFLHQKRGSARYPVETNDLAILLERETDDLDLYADLTLEGESVEGVTDFFPGRKPKVRITRELSDDPRRENRLRTTIAHELGHVHFHSVLWSFDQSMRVPLFLEHAGMHSPRCRRDTVLGARSGDWLEWQAGYASGAFLMPVSAVRSVVAAFVEEEGCFGLPSLQTMIGHGIIHRIQGSFRVSSDAARIRLLQLRLVSEHPPVPTLFTAPGT